MTTPVRPRCPRQSRRRGRARRACVPSHCCVLSTYRKECVGRTDVDDAAVWPHPYRNVHSQCAMHRRGRRDASVDSHSAPGKRVRVVPGRTIGRRDGLGHGIRRAVQLRDECPDLRRDRLHRPVDLSDRPVDMRKAVARSAATRRCVGPGLKPTVLPLSRARLTCVKRPPVWPA